MFGRRIGIILSLISIIFISFGCQSGYSRDHKIPSYVEKLVITNTTTNESVVFHESAKITTIDPDDGLRIEIHFNGKDNWWKREKDSVGREWYPMKIIAIFGEYEKKGNYVPEAGKPYLIKKMIILDSKHDVWARLVHTFNLSPKQDLLDNRVYLLELAIIQNNRDEVFTPQYVDPRSGVMRRDYWTIPFESKYRQ